MRTRNAAAPVAVAPAPAAPAGPLPGSPRFHRWAWAAAYSALLVTALAAVPDGVRQNSALTDLHLPDERWTRADLTASLDALGVAGRTYALTTYLLVLACSVLAFAVAGLVVWRKPGDRAVLTTSLLLAVAAWGTAGTHLALEASHPQWQGPLRAAGSAAFAGLLLLPYVFPDGRFVPRWTRWAALLTVALPFLRLAGPPLAPGSWPSPLGAVLDGVLLLLPLGAAVYRYRRTSTPQQRRQIRWVVLSLVVLVLGVVPLAAAPWLVPALGAPGPGGLLYHLVANSWLLVLLLGVLTAVAVSVLRLRLWDVDPLLGRALVYGGLALLVGAVYAGVHGALLAALPPGGGLLPSLLAAGAVAAVVEPGRRRIQSLVNRLLHGERDDPYEILTRLARRLEGPASPEAVLEAVVRTVREALRVPRAAIEPTGGGPRVLAVAGDGGVGTATGAELRLELVCHGEVVGWLTLAPRTSGEAFGPRDLRLLEGLTRHAGTALFAARAAADLRLARERLVTAGQEERRRLRRELHDVLGPELAASAMDLEVALELAVGDPAAGAGLVGEVRDRLREDLLLVRRLAYELYPPVLDDLGLPAALREQALARLGTRGVAVHLDLPERTGPLPAAVEVAAYRIAAEALANVERHARARSCRLRLAVTGGALELEVTDDGRGIPPGVRAGVGLRSLHERVAELGGVCDVGPVDAGGLPAGSAGGTRVRARLPLGEPAAPSGGQGVPGRQGA